MGTPKRNTRVRIMKGTRQMEESIIMTKDGATEGEVTSEEVGITGAITNNTMARALTTMGVSTNTMRRTSTLREIRNPLPNKRRVLLLLRALLYMLLLKKTRRPYL